MIDIEYDAYNGNLELTVQDQSSPISNQTYILNFLLMYSTATIILSTIFCLAIFKHSLLDFMMISVVTLTFIFPVTIIVIVISHRLELFLEYVLRLFYFSTFFVFLFSGIVIMTTANIVSGPMKILIFTGILNSPVVFLTLIIPPHKRKCNEYDTTITNAKGTCIICIEDIESCSNAFVLTCTHMYHQNCLLQWSEHNPICPLCRAPLYKVAYSKSKWSLIKQKIINIVS